MKDYLVIIILVFAIVLILKNNEGYTDAQYSQLFQKSNQINLYIAQAEPNGLVDLPDNPTSTTASQPRRAKSSVVFPIVLNLILQSSGLITSANSLYETLNKYLPAEKYTSDDEFNTMFSKAYDSGEPTDSSAKTVRDRIALRLIMFPVLSIFKEAKTGTGIDIKYDDLGRPDWTREIATKLNKDIKKDILPFGFKFLAKTFENEDGSLPADFYTMVNSFLPSDMTPFASTSEFNAEGYVKPLTPRMLFIAKVYLTGTSWLAWVAENKMKLDLSWNA